jgi:hypothetical protein
MATRYEADYAGTGQLMRTDEMLAAVADAGAKALAYGEEISPVGKGRDPHPGMYKAGWRMETSSAGGPAHDRAEARIINDALDEVLADVVDGHDVPAKVLAYLEEQGRL